MQPRIVVSIGIVALFVIGLSFSDTPGAQAQGAPPISIVTPEILTPRTEAITEAIRSGAGVDPARRAKQAEESGAKPTVKPNDASDKEERKK